ncbi:hypothetical protein M501DRAFT_1009944 [Patellaria atrata CBS 101060]|uniref:DUF974 domain-containing protein n=1 Tax=Patellaria atrata CBS 101060 TaxID=1346257 RepID=A0A9P4SDF6_9PEZI|nr:hypothetical protein M501DRAFT_1009944 [Patellaria atrata CBS 101060]
MAHQRTHSTGENLKGPHAVSLKVLRLTTPTLGYQYPLPTSQLSEEWSISPKAALAYPGGDVKTPFIISPVFNLPESFGTAYVGETFSCTLCANNELLKSDETRILGGVKIVADMQTPSNPAGVPLDMGDSDYTTVDPGKSLQKIIHFRLKEDGSHLLAVTVTYMETQKNGQQAASGRVRTFRKLYQFVAEQLLSVRTKVGELPSKAGRECFAIEAQLENLAQHPLSLQAVTLNPRPPFKSVPLNWNLNPTDDSTSKASILSSRDVVQVAFYLQQEEGSTQEDFTRQPGENRIILGQLSMQWRSATGNKGSLDTPWLTSRQRS